MPVAIQKLREIHVPEQEDEDRRRVFDVGIQSVREFIAYSAEDFIRMYEEREQEKADFGVNEIFMMHNDFR